MTFELETELWEYPGNGAWYFLTLPLDIASDIRRLELTPKRGFGSVRVQAEIGKTQWDTSIFPDSKTGSYLLPVKKLVRASEGLLAGAAVQARITIVI